MFELSGTSSEITLATRSLSFDSARLNYAPYSSLDSFVYRYGSLKISSYRRKKEKKKKKKSILDSSIYKSVILNCLAKKFFDSFTLSFLWLLPFEKERKKGLTSEVPHMGDCHPEYGQFVRFPGQGWTRRHHVGQFGDVGGHLVPPPPLNFAMILPAVSRKTKPR